MASVTMKQLLESGIHFGHQTRRWNPKMARYIYGERHGIYIIDLRKTLQQLRKAYVTVRDIVGQGGTVLFLGTKKQARDVVREQAERCEMFYVNNRWLGGTLTNWRTIQQSIRRLENLEELESSGKIEQFTKKEGVNMRKQREKLDKNLCGIKKMGGLPAALFVVDSRREDIAIREARRLNIPSIGICDTNSDPDEVTIPIPGNDDAIRAIQFFCGIMADAVIEGQARYEKLRQEESAKEKAAASEALARTEKLEKQQLRGADPDAEAEPEDAVVEEVSADEAAPVEATDA